MDGTLAGALEREHREIDRGIDAFVSRRADEAVPVESLTSALEALRRHIYLEEELVFPALRDAGMVAPVFVMLREHGEMWRTLDALEAELGAGRADAASALCTELVSQLEAHNAKEETILYAQTDAVVPATTSADLRAFLESGRRPEGWRCQRAPS